jgi:hypothetical protein
MFDILGGFVVRFISPESRGRLRTVLRDLAFDCVDLDGAKIDCRASLHAALYHAMDFAELYPGPTNNWEALSDLLWQWVMDETDGEVTKLAFVIENGVALQSRHPQLVFDFAEICIHLATAVRDARVEELKPPLQVRLFLIG